VRRTVPPSAEIEEQIDRLLAVGVGENPRESLSELAKLGARLIIQRAVEDEFDAWLGRPRRVQTAEGELSVEIPHASRPAGPIAWRPKPLGGLWLGWSTRTAGYVCDADGVIGSARSCARGRAPWPRLPSERRSPRAPGRSSFAR
jgi:hypothetical protein